VATKANHQILSNWLKRATSNKIAIVVKATEPIEYLDVETTGFEQAGYGPETK
jgi:uncharacterized protein YprB with RNaseH-like and TPR domain